MGDKSVSEFRRVLLKQALIFQLKLGLDAARDILLSPVAMVVLLIDLLLGHDRKSCLFFRLLRFGRLSDRWINLFGVSQPHRAHRSDSVDHWLGQVEKVIREQQKGGKMSTATKAKLDGYLNKISNTAGKNLGKN